MPTGLVEILEEIKTVWNRWTGGDLYYFEENGSRSLPPGIPPALLGEYLEGRPTEGQTMAGRTWWVKRLNLIPGNRFLVLSADQPSPFAQVLDSWAHLLQINLSYWVDGRGERARGGIRDFREGISDPEHTAEGLRAAARLLKGCLGASDVILVIEDHSRLLVEGVEARFYPRAKEWLESAYMHEPVTFTKNDAGGVIMPIRLTLPTGRRGALIALMSDNSIPVEQEWVSDLEGFLAWVFKPLVSSQHAEADQRFRHELAIAANIHASLFPAKMPVIAGMDLAADLIPARQVGGDFFDLARSSEGEWVLAVGDVAGKGASASILSAVVHAVLQCESPNHRHPGTLLESINARLFADLDRAETFVTMAVGFLDPLRGTIQYAAAGHVDGVLWKAEEERLHPMPATGLPLGISSTSTYDISSTSLDPGDVFLLHTDGITESEDPGGKLLGAQGLTDLMYACHLAPARSQVDSILTALEVHRQGLPQRDDVALLLCRRTEIADEGRLVQPFVFPAEVSSISLAVDLVRNLGTRRLDTPSEIFEDFALALAEVVANQIKHAYRQQSGRIQGRLVLDKNTLTADTFDYGYSFHPVVDSGNQLDPENPPEGGYGMQLIDALTDQWDYSALEGGRNHWRLIKTIPGAVKP
ncbi:MAG: SpoIIE family protein phosphatase [Anaerolineales bacterium]|nr:SpoIIE family protein phosphatase [Anaerolineales bacterium]